MEAELNIAEILKDKPKDTPLYSKIYGKCKLWEVEDEDTVRTMSETHINGKPYSGTEVYLSNGKVCDEGRVMLFPSDVMQDWSKFAWEKGDVLRKGNTFVMFAGWVGDDYSEFKAAFEIFPNGSFDNGDSFLTKDFRKAEYELSKKFVKKVEKYYRCSIDPKTFTISNYEDFKDGDVLATNESKFFAKCIFIFSRRLGNKFFYHALLNTNNRSVYRKDGLELDTRPRLATEEEKQALFSALKKNNKRWDEKCKKVVGILQDDVFKAFDKVLVRDVDMDNWNAALFSHKEGNLFYIANGSYKLQCIPYNESTKHLLGTNEYYKSNE